MNDDNYIILPKDEVPEKISYYSITSIPNDFNVLTIYNFLEKGIVEIPIFQRNYIWDIKTASKLIDSILLGLPIPQIFLYEKDRNAYQIIDGQQRLLSIYYFIKQKFPKPGRASELRKIFYNYKSIPDYILNNDEYFIDFSLRFDKDYESKFTGLKYSTLNEYKTEFEMRTIRNILITQREPEDDDSSIYEIFNRLNTGGKNLNAQEIRMSMYYSPFYEMIMKINESEIWRKIFSRKDLHDHFLDFEILLRAFSFLIYLHEYSPSQKSFLNKASKKFMKYKQDKVDNLKKIMIDFLTKFSSNPTIFVNKQSKFNVTLFESVFYAYCHNNIDNIQDYDVDIMKIAEISNSEDFTETLLKGSSSAVNVKKRFNLAVKILCQ